MAISQCTLGVGFSPSFQTRDDSAVRDFFFPITKTVFVLPVSGFKLTLGESIVVFGYVVHLDLRLVHNGLRAALPP